MLGRENAHGLRPDKAFPPADSRTWGRQLRLSCTAPAPSPQPAPAYLIPFLKLIAPAGSLAGPLPDLLPAC